MHVLLAGCRVSLCVFFFSSLLFVMFEGASEILVFKWVPSFVHTKSKKNTEGNERNNKAETAGDMSEKTNPHAGSTGSAPYGCAYLTGSVADAGKKTCCTPIPKPVQLFDPFLIQRVI